MEPRTDTNIHTNNTSSNARIIKNSLYMSVRMIIILFIQLYTTRVLLSALGVEDYGIYNVVCGFVAMFSFLSTSMMNGIQRFYNYEYGRDGESGIARVFNVAIRIQVTLAFLMAAVIEVAGLWYIQNKMVIPSERLGAALCVFQSSILNCVITLLQVPYISIVVAKEKLNFYAVMSVVNSVLGICVVLLIKYFAFDSLVMYGFLLVVVQLVILIIYILYTRYICENLVITRKYDKNLLKSMLGFSGWNVFGSFGTVIKEQGINMILNLFCGPVVNAARGIANQVNGGFQGFVSNITISVRPQITQSYAQGNIERVMSLTYAISKFSCILLFMFSFPILLDIDYVLQLWLGDNVPAHTSTFVIIIVISSFISNLNGAVSGVVHSSGNMKLYQIVGAVVNLVALPLVYIFLYFGFSPESALWIMLVIMVIGQILALIILKTIVNYSLRDYISKVIIPIFQVAVLSMILPYFLHSVMPSGIFRFIIISIFSIVETIIIAYMIGTTTSEKEMIKTLINKVINKRQYTLQK